MAGTAQREARVAPELAPPLKPRRHAVGSGEYCFLLMEIDVRSESDFANGKRTGYVSKHPIYRCILFFRLIVC